MKKCLGAVLSKYPPQDVQPILNPIDFIVFNGLKQYKTVDEIIFLACKTGTSITPLKNTIKTTIQKQNYDFTLLRVDQKGNITHE